MATSYADAQKAWIAAGGWDSGKTISDFMRESDSPPPVQAPAPAPTPAPTPAQAPTPAPAPAVTSWSQTSQPVSATSSVAATPSPAPAPAPSAYKQPAVVSPAPSASTTESPFDIQYGGYRRTTPTSTSGRYVNVAGKYQWQEDGSVRLSQGRTYVPSSDTIYYDDNRGSINFKTGIRTLDNGLQRKMTDAEIAYYRNDLNNPTIWQHDATPTDGSSFGGGSGTGGRTSTGTNGTTGTATSSSGSSSLLNSGTTGTIKDATTREVDPAKETIEGRIGSLLGTDANGNYTNAVVQQAAETALKSFASRGLLNSSMAQQAAYNAAISKAVEIAGPDAQTYYAQGRANQDAINVFAQAANANVYDNQKLDKQLAVQWAQLDWDKESFQKNLDAEFAKIKLSADLEADAKDKAYTWEQTIANNNAVNTAYNNYVSRLSQIDADPNLSASEKVKLKNQAGVDFDRFASYYGVADSLDLGNRFTSADEVGDDSSSDTTSTAATEDNGGYA